MKLLKIHLKAIFKVWVQLKILYVLPYDWGAMPQYTAELANAVSKYEEVTVIGSKDINKKYFSERVEIIKTFDNFNFSMNNLKNLFSLKTLKSFFSFRSINIINTINPDIVHLTTPVIPPLSIYISLFKLDTKYKFVYTKHGIFSNSGFKEKILEVYVLGFFEKLINFAKIIVHTQKDKDAFLNLKKANEETVAVIPHGTYSFFKNYGGCYPAEKDCILFFGNIREYKGLKYLIQAIPLILKEIPDLKVIIAGEGDISEFSSFIENNKSVFEVYNEFISDEKVSELFQRTEIVVMPYTKMSGQSGILSVALAFNKPIVSSNVGGINEVVEDGITGFLVPPQNSEALGDAIINILKNDTLLSDMKSNLLDKSQELSWDNIAKIHIELYSKLLSDSPKNN
ncbi:glycosyl transferase [Methanosarcina horonobensis HB-1 = JCM 15518]|uniref:Glycosyl transferase n=1 Tax=Methanosarcina horonobensis HB-1 = JCM 15518 TaxID=1434110 RepID=A0A0E3SBK7_9EURY|nr:glycosyl transferase [Methanosarcina horonobensis HB-1 = JCM 15518]